MSIHAFPPRAGHELGGVVDRAGAVFNDRSGRSVALNYGSAAGELAACVTRAGLADRSELLKLSLEGPQQMLEQVVFNLTGAVLAPGGATFTGAAWWCAAGPQRVLVLSEPASGDRLHSRIRRLLTWHPSLRIRDVSVDWNAIAILGRRAGEVLAALGVYGEAGDPRSVAPVTCSRIADVDVTWLLQSDHRALALVGHRDAPAVWHALHSAGEHFGICAVGHEAVTRYTLLARTHPEL